MYNVVVIDDEPVVVNGVTKEIPWNRWNCKVVGTAYNGYEGRRTIMKYRPNIVICDIAIPGSDGLGMLERAKADFEDMEISILTEYRDFECARKAMNLGVTRFLLKPSNLKELEEAVETMTGNLRKKNILSESNENVGEEAETDSSCFIIKNAMKYIDEHYSENLTLSNVAEHIYVSRWHLSKLLNRKAGQNFSEVLNKRRIAEAKKLLRDSSLRIGDVSEMVGFLDFAHFSRVFKKIEGISANEYRNKI